MEINSLISSVNTLISHWANQGIITRPNYNLGSPNKNNNYDILKSNDFKYLFSKTNGMMNLYPNDSDDDGFLFYPLEYVLNAQNELGFVSFTYSDVLLFADYMQKSWWYGVRITDSLNYTIGIIPDQKTFTPITDSLVKFIGFYINDSHEMYTGL